MLRKKETHREKDIGSLGRFCLLVGGPALGIFILYLPAFLLPLSQSKKPKSILILVLKTIYKVLFTWNIALEWLALKGAFASSFGLPMYFLFRIPFSCHPLAPKNLYWILYLIGGGDTQIWFWLFKKCFWILWMRGYIWTCEEFPVAEHFLSMSIDFLYVSAYPKILHCFVSWFQIRVVFN